MEQKDVVLAEDDELLGALLSYRLEKAGYNVSLLVDGKEVREHLQNNKPDIIVTDIMMPYYSGIELIDYVRQEIGLSTPIIVISTADNEVNVLNAFQLGADDFLPKPIRPAELLVRMERILCSE